MFCCCCMLYTLTSNCCLNERRRKNIDLHHACSLCLYKSICYSALAVSYAVPLIQTSFLFVGYVHLFEFRSVIVLLVIFACTHRRRRSSFSYAEREMNDVATLSVTAASSAITVSHLVVACVCSFAAGVGVTLLVAYVVRRYRRRDRPGEGRHRRGARNPSTAQNLYSCSPSPSSKSAPGFFVDCGTYNTIEVDSETLVVARNKLTVSDATLKRNLMLRSTGSFNKTRLNLENTDPALL